MKFPLQSTLVSLCRAVHQQPEGQPAAQAAFVRARLQDAPDYLRVPLKVPLLLIELLGLAFGGRPFSRLELEQQQRCLAWLRRLPLSPVQDYLRLVEAFSIYRGCQP